MKGIRTIALLLIGWGWMTISFILYIINEAIENRIISTGMYSIMVLIVVISGLAIYLKKRYHHRKIKLQEEIMKRRYLEQIKQLQNKTSYTKNP